MGVVRIEGAPGEWPHPQRRQQFRAGLERFGILRFAMLMKDGPERAVPRHRFERLLPGAEVEIVADRDELLGHTGANVPVRRGRRAMPAAAALLLRLCRTPMSVLSLPSQAARGRTAGAIRRC